MSALTTPSNISLPGFRTTLELYPLLVEKVYKSKSKDDSKATEAIRRDKWRFEELPATLAALKNAKKTAFKAPDVDDGGLTKDALERLVQWKITHGHFRPFLPGMVRKNEASTVRKQTALCFEVLASSDSFPPSISTIKQALDIVCKLSGIGPATGTLILSVFDPIGIPFFQDEMFAWFFPAPQNTKLKYNQKEYIQLLEATRPVLQRLEITAVELEKVSYVLGNKHLLGEDERKQLEQALRRTSLVNTTEQGETSATRQSQLETGLQSSLMDKASGSKNVRSQNKRPAESMTADSLEPPGKRRSQRKK